MTNSSTPEAVLAEAWEQADREIVGHVPSDKYYATRARRAVELMGRRGFGIYDANNHLLVDRDVRTDGGDEEECPPSA